MDGETPNPGERNLLRPVLMVKGVYYMSPYFVILRTKPVFTNTFFYYVIKNCSVNIIIKKVYYIILYMLYSNTFLFCFYCYYCYRNLSFDM